jgi:signal transduction histidine kinase
MTIRSILRKKELRVIPIRLVCISMMLGAVAVNMIVDASGDVSLSQAYYARLYGSDLPLSVRVAVPLAVLGMLAAQIVSCIMSSSAAELLSFMSLLAAFITYTVVLRDRLTALISGATGVVPHAIVVDEVFYGHVVLFFELLAALCFVVRAQRLSNAKSVETARSQQRRSDLDALRLAERDDKQLRQRLSSPLRSSS